MELTPAWRTPGFCWGRECGTGQMDSPPGVVVQRSLPLLQGQVPLHRGLCKLLRGWLEQKA